MLVQVETLFRELRHAVRFLLHAPGHTAAVVALLALGIGANAAMFSLVNALFLRQLPVPEPDRLVVINPYWSTALFDDFRRAQTSFSGIFGAGSLVGAVVSTEPDRGQIHGVRGGIVSGNYFQVLGVGAVLGRVFTEADDSLNDAQPVMVIGAGFWRRQFGGDPQVLGRRLYLSGSPFTIVGVTAFTDDLPGRVRDLWVPLNTQPIASPQGDLRANRGFRWLSVMGRLKPGVTLAQAQAEAEVVYERAIAAAEPRAPTANERARRTPIQLEGGGRGFGGFRRRLAGPLRILASAVAVVLLIVWANVATLLLARAAGRRREMAVRQALGCGRARMVRQVFLEGLLTALAGGILGLLVAPLCARVLLLLQPGTDSIDLDLSVDANLLLFGAGASLLTAAAFSLAPAISAARTPIEQALRGAARGSTGSSAAGQRTIRAIIALQTALSVALVAVALLLARSLIGLHEVPSGFDREHIISATVNPRLAGYRDEEEQARLGERLVERLSAVPGVTSASVGLCAVLMGCSRAAVVNMEGHQPRPGDPPIWINPVSANYFETAGIPLRSGRAFTAQDRRGSTRVAVVTEALARFYFPGQSAIGKRFTERAASGQPVPVEIAGIAADVKFVNPRDPPIRMAFLSLEQSPGPFSYVQVRTAGPPAALVPAVRQAILEVDSKLPLFGPQPLSDILDIILGRDTLVSRASAVFAIIAMLLACFGVYGVISYLVAATRTEIGIRLALGAQPGQVLREVIAGALRTVAPGIALGIAGAWAAGRFIESLLFGVTRHDAWTYVLVAAMVLVTTSVAAYLPARRASRIDPLSALRCE